MNTLEKIDGVELYPIIALLLFFTFFVLVGYLVIKSDKNYIEEMSNLPLDNDTELHQESNNKMNQ